MNEIVAYNEYKSSIHEDRILPRIGSKDNKKSTEYCVHGNRSWLHRKHTEYAANGLWDPRIRSKEGPSNHERMFPTGCTEYVFLILGNVLPGSEQNQ